VLQTVSKHQSVELCNRRTCIVSFKVLPSVGRIDSDWQQNHEVLPMRRIILAAVAAVFCVVASNNVEAGLFHNRGCCEPAPTCCEAPAPVCCEAPAPSCCEEAPCCGHRHLLGGLFHRNKGCCAAPAPSCCEPAPVCCEPAPAPSCCEAAPTCCEPACGHRHLLRGLFNRNKCCEPAPSCGCEVAPSCGCEAAPSCGCGM
jgi:hypothetical protein